MRKMSKVSESTKEQKENRMKRFGLPVKGEPEKNESRNEKEDLRRDFKIDSKKNNPKQKIQDQKKKNRLDDPNFKLSVRNDPLEEISELTSIRRTVEIPSKKRDRDAIEQESSNNTERNVERTTVITTATLPTAKKTKASVTKEEEQLQITVPNNSTTNKINVRCFYYPKCAKADCPYLHPDTPCAAFPNCPFGSNCRYIHPPCKYTDRCSRPGCPYAHSGFSMIDCKNGFACPDKGSTCPYRHPGIACKFALLCKNKVACVFSHAKICMNGPVCQTVGCKFAHVVKSEQPNKDGQEHTITVNEQDIQALSNSLALTPPREDPSEEDK